MQLRLLCNLLDGMVAIEGGRKSKVGVLYNEVPDRVADSLFLVALGYAIGIAWLGWLAALAAAVTAYIRVLGGTFGLAQDFRGPLAKQHRMAVMTAGCLLGIGEYFWTGGQRIVEGGGLDHRLRLDRHLRHAHPRDRAAVEGALTLRPSSTLLVGIVKLLVGAYARWIGTHASAGAAHLLRQSHQPHRHAGHLVGVAARTAPAHPAGGGARLLGHGNPALHRDARAGRRAHRSRKRRIPTVDPLEPLRAALRDGDSLIIFPEGTRGTSAAPARFRSGLYRLASEFPRVELIPVYLDNLHRSLPKGARCRCPWFARCASARRWPGDRREIATYFLERARNAVIALGTAAT